MSISEDFEVEGENTIQYITSENCNWSEDELNELKTAYDIFFMSKGPDSVIPVKIEKLCDYDGKPRYIITLGSEDDGTISFDVTKDIRFDAAWLDGLIADLQAAKKYLKELK